MQTAPEYPIWVQARIPVSLAALHNYICLHDPTDRIFTLDRDLQKAADPDAQIPAMPAEYFSQYVSPEEKKRALENRDRIAQECWDQYVTYLAEHGDSDEI